MACPIHFFQYEMRDVGTTGKPGLMSRFSYTKRALQKGVREGGNLMAVVNTPQESRIGIMVANGVSATGANLFKTLRFSNVKPTALDQDLYDVAISLSGLMAAALVAINRTDDAAHTSE